jgi:hypothetical protein
VTTADQGGDADDDHKCENIPNEIWILVLGYLDPKTLATSFALVNKRFFTLTLYEPLWEKIYHSYFLPWRNGLDLVYYNQLYSLLRVSNGSSPRREHISWRYVVKQRYLVERKYLERVLLQYNILQEYARIVKQDIRSLDIRMVELLSDHGDILLNAARVEEEKIKNGTSDAIELHLWLRLFCIELYEACLTFIPSEWRRDVGSIPYIPTNTTAVDTLPKDLSEYSENYPPFWRSIHNLAIVITDLHGFIIRNNQDHDVSCEKLKILITNLILKYEENTVFEQCFPSPIANWARLLLDCGSDMMEFDVVLSQQFLEKSIYLFSKELSITTARQLPIEFDSCYCYADALVRLAAVMNCYPSSRQYYDRMGQLLDKSYQLFKKCCELKPTDFITIYRTGLVVIRQINLNVLMKDNGIEINSLHENHEKLPLSLTENRRKLVHDACQCFKQCIQVQDYYRAHEMWGMVLFDEAERLYREWLINIDSYESHEPIPTNVQQIANELYDILQQAIDQYTHAQKAMNQMFMKSHLIYYCEEDIACATSRQFEIRLRQLNHAKLEEQYLIHCIENGLNEREHKRKLKIKQATIKQLKRDMSRLHYKAMVILESLLEKRKWFSLFHIARLKCLLGDENQTKRNLYKILGTDDYDAEIGKNGQVILQDSAFLNVKNKLWFTKFIKKLCKRNQRLMNESILIRNHVK